MATRQENQSTWKNWTTWMKKGAQKRTRSLSKDSVKDQVLAFHRCFNLPPGEKIINSASCELSVPHGSYYGVLFTTANAVCYLSDNEAAKIVIPMCNIRNIAPCRYTRHSPQMSNINQLPDNVKRLPYPPQKHTATLTPIMGTQGELPPEVKSDAIMINMHNGDTWNFYNFTGAVRNFNLISFLLNVYSGMHRPQDLRPAGARGGGVGQQAGQYGQQQGTQGQQQGQQGQQGQYQPSAPDQEMSPPSYRSAAEIGTPQKPYETRAQQQQPWSQRTQQMQQGSQQQGTQQPGSQQQGMQQERDQGMQGQQQGSQQPMQQGQQGMQQQPMQQPQGSLQQSYGGSGTDM